MKHTICFITFFLCLFTLVAQPPSGQTEADIEQQLENITAANDDADTEDDSYLQQMRYFATNPINLNYADETQLKQLRILTPIQIANLFQYRKSLGLLVNIYELQAIPGWDIPTIQKIKPFVTVAQQQNLIDNFLDRTKLGEHSLLARVSQILEKSEGYKIDPTAGKNFYEGSQQRVFLRYKYQYKNLLQYGVVAEKDAGESLFKGYQKQGFDFYSAHVFMRKVGIIKSLALGDYTVNMGQGLTQWMSLAFKKSPDVLATKRESEVLRPYNSLGEILFHRGAGITIGRKKWEATAFASYKKIDANFDIGDSLDVDDDVVTSIQTSGFHRTKNEAADKGIQRQLAYGGNFTYKTEKLKLSLNGIQYNYKLPLQKDNQPYNKFALAGNSFGNYSFDYAYTYKNIHLFGEAAVTNKLYPATINGMLVSVANNVDLSFVYRNISKGYQALYTSAFTESTLPTNERGLFSGISIRPSNAWRIDAYVDVYKFPWLKFRVNAPTTGRDFLTQVAYRPNKVFDLYVRFKAETKSINFNPFAATISPVVAQPKQNFRTQFSYKVHPNFTFRSRVEALWFDKNGDASETGFLLFTDCIYKPIMKPFSANIRLQYFETDGFNSRLYAFENDVQYSYSIPAFSEKGYRYYLNLNYDVSKKLTFWARIAQTLFPERSSIGSGLDEINRNRRTEVKLQGLYRF
jgi:Helix-hairpin-helix motif